MNALNRLLVLFFSVVMLFACGGGGNEDMAVATEKTATDTGRMKILSVPSDGVMSVQMPFADSDGHKCTQNSSGDTSHFYNSTRSDLDFSMNVGTIVVAAADGVFHRGTDIDANGDGFGWYGKVDHGNGYWTMYGHLSGYIATEGQRVVAGQPIAYSGGKENAPGSGSSTGPHLHFGVHSGPGVGVSKRMSVYALNRNTGELGYFVTGDAQVGSDFVCGLSTGHTYESRPIGATFGEFHCEVAGGGVVCWKGNPTDCVDGNSHVWYHKNNEGRYFSESDADTWQKCLQTTGPSNVFAYLEGGYGVGGTGPGIEIIPDTPPAEEPPDFIGKRSWLETPWGVETYKYGRTETVKMKGQFKNEGSGPCLSTDATQTIIVHAYHSNGYNEDVHSGTGAWTRVGTDEIQCTNLQPGDTHTETEGLILSGLDVGIHNIVWCIDHPQDDHNNPGQHAEKHESNNCTTEAVFEVVEGTVNVPNTDLVTFGLTVIQAPVYAGDPIRLGAWVKNQGTVNAIVDIRSSYTVSCNGGPTTMLTDDGTMATTMVAGASAWEEILTPVLMPNVVGTCTLTFTADYLGAQPETDETNNSTSITVTLAPRPAPILSITKFQDQIGCCTTNTGSRIKPDIWVYNGGPVAPASNVTVIYHIASPVATGGAYIYIGYGVITPGELPPGGTDEDYMEGSGFQIPQNSAWKLQWHTIRGCIKTDGGTPVGGGPGEVCAYYGRYSKK